MKITRSAGTVLGIAAVAALGLAGCSSSDDATPSESPTPTSASPTATSASPSTSPTTPSGATKYALSAGGTAKIAGQGSPTYKSTGGEMTFKQTDGVLGGTIEVFAKGNAQTGDFDIKLVTNASGAVTSGSLTSPGTEYKVTGKSGKINFLTTDKGTTLVTVSAIPVQAGTQTPTTMTLNLTGNKS
ncbi:MAG: hypothetical protein HQ526_01305 [Actinobacteria bacterium]|nr:hypothetical protein [Actinomycetota bacterium]